MRNRRQSQSGYALAAISLLGLGAMSVTAVAITDGGVGDAAAVEENLIRVRANWAVTGHMNYMLSRARQDGLCDTDCQGADATRRSQFTDYGEEVYNANVAGPKNGNGAIQLRWAYDEIRPEYAIDTGIAVVDTNTSTDGRLRLEVRYENSNARADDIDVVLDRIPEFDAEICGGLADPADNCPAVITNDNLSGIVRIVDFRVKR